MRYFSLRQITGLGLMLAGLAAGQQKSSAPAPTTTPNPTTTTTTPTTGGTSTTPGRSSQPSQSSQPSRPAQPVFVSGNVTLPDGSEPPERLLIERVCSGNKVRAEGYTDSKGRFSFQLGQSQMVLPDASESTFTDGTQGFGNTGNSNTSNSSSMDPLLDCELRARLPGYRSSTVMLAGRRGMDNPSVGTLVVYPLNGDEGQAISATGANASKEARKAFERGSNSARKLKWEQAEQELHKAVDLHPKYAEAWLELGKTYMARQRYDAARGAFRQAIQADPKFVYPYDELYKVDFELRDWEDMAEATSKLVRLNPYEFPAAYYFNGVAQFELQKWDLAEKSLKKALDEDKRHANPKALYVMGLVLIQKHDYDGALDALSEFAERSPNDPTMPKVKTLLTELQKSRR